MDDIDYKQYTVSFDKNDVASLYSDWKGILDPQTIAEPLLMNSFGDLLYKQLDGAVYFLDTLEGTITKFAEDESDMITKLTISDNQNNYLSSEMVTLLRERGLVLNSNELYIYVPHPSFTGTIDMNTIQIMSMDAVLSLNGQSLS